MRRLHIARVIVAVALGLAMASVGCGESPSSPTPPPAPPTASPPIPAATSIRAVNPEAGQVSGDVVIHVLGSGFQVGASVTFDGAAVPVIEVASQSIAVRIPPHAAGVVEVAVTNPDGSTARLPRGYTYGFFSVTASTRVVTAGGELTISWLAPEGRNCNGGGDWIAIYRIGDPDDTGASNGHSDLWYDHLCGATTGSRTLSAPDQPGHYEFRYMVWGTSVARSEPVTVGASGAASFSTARRPVSSR